MKLKNTKNHLSYGRRYGLCIQAFVYALIALTIAVAGIDLAAAPKGANPQEVSAKDPQGSKQQAPVLEDRILVRYGIGEYYYSNTFAVPFTYRLSNGRTVRPLLGRKLTDFGKTRVTIKGSGEVQSVAVAGVVGGLQIAAGYIDYDMRNEADRSYPLYAADGGMAGHTIIASAQYTFFRENILSPVVTVLYAHRRNRYNLQNFVSYNEAAGDYNYYRLLRLKEGAIRNEYGSGLRLRIPAWSVEVTLYYQYALNRFTLDLDAPSPVHVASTNLVPELQTLPADAIQNDELSNSGLLTEKTNPDFHFAGIRIDYRPFQNLLLSTSVRKNTTTNTWESISSVLFFLHANFGIAFTHLDFDAARLGRNVNTTVGPVFTMKL